MPTLAHLKLHGQGHVEVDLAAAYLSDLSHAYNSVLVFEGVLDDASRAAREMQFRYPLAIDYGWLHPSRRSAALLRDWPPPRAAVASYIPLSERLTISAVRLSSPGFWEFVGKLNPLEVLRQYLNDRHERRKDREYRESAEKRRLTLENLRLENDVIAGRLKLAKELGATDRDLTPILNELVFRPLTGLDKYQDRDVIDRAEILPRWDGNKRDEG